MTKLVELRQRIRAIENIQTVTRTLATVAAARLARTRDGAAGLRRYAAAIREILSDQAAHLARVRPGFAATSPLLAERWPVRNVALLVLTSDRGMCGGYNVSICRVASEFLRRRAAAGQGVRIVARGRKGAAHFRRHGAEVVHAEEWGRHVVGAADVARLAAVLNAPYFAGEVEEVHVAYAEYHSPVVRVPKVMRLLPLELPIAASRRDDPAEAWSYEPDFASAFEALAELFLEVQLHDVLLEAQASEQGARMMTMEEATERADKALQEHRIRHNRLRREAITVDLLGALFAAGAAEEASRAP